MKESHEKRRAVAAKILKAIEQCALPKPDETKEEMTPRERMRRFLILTGQDHRHE